MKRSESTNGNENLEANSGGIDWTHQKPWREFVEWMQIYGILDPSLLEQEILNQLQPKPDGDANAQRADTDQTFTLMVLRLAIFEAALTDEKKRKNLHDVEAQIQETFPRQWSSLGEELRRSGIAVLMDKARELFKAGTYCRKPDTAVSTLRPIRVGEPSYEHWIERKPSESSNDGVEAVGPALYRSTLRSSNMALLGAVSLQSILDRLVAEDKDKASRRAAVEARKSQSRRATIDASVKSSHR